MLRLLLLLALASPALAGPVDEQRDALQQAAPAPSAAAEVDGGLAGYVRLALSDSPDVRAAYARWEAEVAAIRGSAPPPNPTLGFGLFLQSVETRVGPQQARLSLAQSLPWPDELAGRRDAAVARARQAQARFDATVLAAAAEVRRAYWTLWAVRTTRATHGAHLAVLDDLSATLRARVEIGAATLADLQQVDLSRARLEDALASMDAQERRAAAWLRAAIAGRDGELPTAEAPGPAQLQTPLADALALAEQHPSLDVVAARRAEAVAARRVARGQQAPGLRFGLDWTITGPGPTAQPDSGKDALMAGVGLSLPLWQGAYAGRAGAASSNAVARDAEADALRLELAAAVEDAWLRVTDGARRVGVVRATLLPQAEATYESLLGSYAVGDAGVAQVLLAQRDLLELQVQRDQDRAERERAWADLEQLCGAALPRAEAPEAP
jgi:cobalt-zinc-cadmium efflux system outer membrane protein